MSKANNFQKMRELSFYQQAAVAIVLLERMLPNYQLFAEVSSFGDAALPRHTLDLVWEWLQVRRAKINFERRKSWSSSHRKLITLICLAFIRQWMQ